MQVMKMLGEVYKTTVGATTIELPSLPTETKYVYIQVEGQEIRAKFNSTNGATTGVTEGSGILLPINTIAHPFHVFETYDTLKAMRLHRNTTSDATINVIYFGEGQPS